ncbi:MAG: class I SAM-dependent methyltransferase [Ruminococcaceae bacterium]|nr:class I SAM-dependent methyltransferase [Oscillospiraceae bacterium]
MKADYKNWVPKGLLYLLGLFALLLYSITILLLCATIDSNTKVLSAVLSLAVAILLTAIFLHMFRMYRAFSYNGNRKLSKQIVDGLAGCIDIPENGLVLDVGCGSGALTIALAKRNPTAKVIGIDRWGREYASFSKNLCENNAKAEGVQNTEFISGDAVKLDFPDEVFDAVTSNYVYHNIIGINRDDLLMETLRLLKKGGRFAIHDIFSESKYGNMPVFIERLKKMGYENVKLVDTTNGIFMTKKEASMYNLRHSAILYGKK